METQIGSLKASFEWTFLTQEVKNKGKLIKSDLLSIEQIPDCKFSILVEHCPFAPDELTIIVRKSNHERAEIDCIFVIPTHGRIQSYSSKDNDWTTYKLFCFPSTCLNGVSFTVFCDFTWYQSSLGLNNDVKPFLLDPSLSDFTIVIDEEELPVHKFILGVQSSVFLAMFESDMEESKKNKVTIGDIRLDVMMNVLSFLYTGSQEALDDSQMALDMWIVAKKYNIEKLKDLCEDKLCGLITESNLLGIFEHAEDHGLEELRCACLKFIKDNKEKITDVPQFKTSFFEKPKLMYTLFYELLRDKK